MYKCVACGHLFEDGEQKTYRENMGECHGSPAYQEFSVCPICGEDYEEVKPCKICGSYEHETDNGFCEECQKDIMKRFNQLIKDNFSEEEIEFLKEEQEYGLL
jgi:RecJ-like exonuclease